MGCWGVKAFESDEGLDGLEWIINHIPEDGCLRLKELLEQLKLDEWCRPPAAENGESHSSTMLIAELMESFQNGTIEERENAQNNQWNGWFEETNWNKWQEHMESLIETMRKILEQDGEVLDLIPQTKQEISEEHIEGGMNME